MFLKVILKLLSFFLLFFSSLSLLNAYTNVSNCGVSLLTPQEYRLNQNISTTSGTCFSIFPNIIFDCQGFTLIGNRSNTAFAVFSDSNVTIKNCVVDNFSIGIHSNSFSSDNIFRNFTISNSSDVGIRVYALNEIFDDFRFFGNRENFIGGINNSFFNFYSLNNGVFQIRSVNSTYENISILNSSGNGMGIYNTNNARNKFKNLRIENSNGYGFFYSAAVGPNFFSDSYFGSNLNYGIVMQNGDIFERGVVENNLGGGAFLLGDNNIVNNVIFRNNSPSGVVINSNNNTVSNSTFNLNIFREIDLFSGVEFNLFYGNRFSNSSNLLVRPNNYFSYSFDGFDVGNYWEDFISGGCNATISDSNYVVCTSHGSYTISLSSSIYDNYPLVDNAIAKPQYFPVQSLFSSVLVFLFLFGFLFI